jgi:hypothetical protein
MSNETRFDEFRKQIPRYARLADHEIAYAVYELAGDGIDFDHFTKSVFNYTMPDHLKRGSASMAFATGMPFGSRIVSNLAAAFSSGDGRSFDERVQGYKRTFEESAREFSLRNDRLAGVARAAGAIAGYGALSLGASAAATGLGAGGVLSTAAGGAAVAAGAGEQGASPEEAVAFGMLSAIPGGAMKGARAVRERLRGGGAPPPSSGGPAPGGPAPGGGAPEVAAPQNVAGWGAVNQQLGRVAVEGTGSAADDLLAGAQAHLGRSSHGLAGAAGQAGTTFLNALGRGSGLTGATVAGLTRFGKEAAFGAMNKLGKNSIAAVRGRLAQQASDVPLRVPAAATASDPALMAAALGPQTMESAGAMATQRLTQIVDEAIAGTIAPEQLEFAFMAHVRSMQKAAAQQAQQALPQPPIVTTTPGSLSFGF